MTNFGIILPLFIFASSFFNILFAENCQLQNLQSYIYQDLVAINASNFWIYSLQNDCSLRIWSNNDTTNEKYNYNNNYSNDGIFQIHKNLTKCKHGQISTSSSKDTVSVQVFVQNNEGSKIFITTLSPDKLEKTKVAKLKTTFILKNINQSIMQPLSCYSMPRNVDHSSSKIKPFIICIFYNFNESRLFSGIYDSRARNFSNLNSINGLKNQTETLHSFFSTSNASVSFYRDDFNQKLTVYLYNENGDFLVLENRALSSTFTFAIKKLTKMQKNYQNFIHISSFEPFSILFEAFTSEFCSSENNICRRFLFPFLTDPSPICFDERKKEQNQSNFNNVGIIFNNFQLKSDILNPYADNNLIFKTHGFLILIGILLISTIFLTILLTFCVLGICKCLKDVASEADEIEVSQSVHEDIIAPSAQLNNQVVERESDAVAARTIIVVESLTVQFEENKEEECEKEPYFKPENFSFYIKE